MKFVHLSEAEARKLVTEHVEYTPVGTQYNSFTVVTSRQRFNSITKTMEFLKRQHEQTGPRKTSLRVARHGNPPSLRAAPSQSLQVVSREGAPPAEPVPASSAASLQEALLELPSDFLSQNVPQNAGTSKEVMNKTFQFINGGPPVAQQEHFVPQAIESSQAAEIYALKTENQLLKAKLHQIKELSSP